MARARDRRGGTGGGVPGTEAAVVTAGIEGWCRGGEVVNCGSCYALLEAGDDFCGFGSTFGEVVEVTAEGERDYRAVGSTSGPDNSDLLVGDADCTFLAHGPGLNDFICLDIPYFDGPVSARRYKSF